jgi:hypothetical protein
LRMRARGGQQHGDESQSTEENHGLIVTRERPDGKSFATRGRTEILFRLERHRRIWH